MRKSSPIVTRYNALAHIQLLLIWAMALGKDSDRLRTMLQKFNKCEVLSHSVVIQEINFYPIFCEIRLGKI